MSSENPTVYASCGTIRTTINDWAKYIGWHIKESAGPVLKNDKTLRHLHDGVVNRSSPGQKYGFSWIHFKSSFGRTLQHAGNNTNQFSLVWVMPKAKRATIVITNTGHKQGFTACDAATAILMKSPAFRWQFTLQYLLLQLLFAERLTRIAFKKLRVLYVFENGSVNNLQFPGSLLCTFCCWLAFRLCISLLTRNA